jgi:hypothetical protein
MTPENMKESELKPLFLYQSQEAPEPKLEMAAASDFVRQGNNDSAEFAGRASLPQVKESAARIRFRFSKGRGIF